MKQFEKEKEIEQEHKEYEEYKTNMHKGIHWKEKGTFSLVQAYLGILQSLNEKCYNKICQEIFEFKHLKKQKGRSNQIEIKLKEEWQDYDKLISLLKTKIKKHKILPKDFEEYKGLSLSELSEKLEKEFFENEAIKNPQTKENLQLKEIKITDFCNEVKRNDEN